MRLEENEYKIDGDNITISRKALEEWKRHYQKAADESKKSLLMWGLYIGKADVLIDLLKHFEEE